MDHEYDKNPIHETLQRRKRRKLKKKLKLAIFLGVVIIIVFFFVSDFSKVKSIDIQGIDVLKESEILDCLSIDDSSYYLFIDKEGTEKEILALGPVKKAHVSCDFMGHVSIEIEEALPVAYASIGDDVYEINDAGKAFCVQDQQRIQLLKSFVHVQNFKDQKMLNAFAKEFYQVSTLMQNEMSDIFLNPEPADPTLLKCLLKNNKVIMIRIEDLATRLTEDQFSYEAYQKTYQNVCEFRFTKKNLFLTECGQE